MEEKRPNALEMAEKKNEERETRKSKEINKLIYILKNNNIYKWFDDFLFNTLYYYMIVI